jgi:UDP-N-acetylglucosamine 2-epimerase (non-hydrolysing)
VHTGQHYDRSMSDVFFEQLGLPHPDANLDVGSGSHAFQTAEIMKRLDQYLDGTQVDWVLVYGDVNSTVAATLVCVKRGIRVAHVEAGLRSNDRSMPEEINRIVTDSLADLLFTPSPDGNENLTREGIPDERIHFVGNVMIDTLVRLLPHAEAMWPALAAQHQLEPNGYVLATLHRPSNVDNGERLRRLMETLRRTAARIPVVFPVHPRTRQLLQELDLSPEAVAGIRLMDPLSYLAFLVLQRYARLVITDSGGVQEETTYLGVPCLTVRANTERPITIANGTNQLVGTDPTRLLDVVERTLDNGVATHRVPALWDGRASERIALVFRQLLRSAE